MITHKNIRSFIGIIAKGFLVLLFSFVIVAITNYGRIFETLFYRMGGLFYTIIYLIGLTILVTIVLLTIVFNLPALKRIFSRFSGTETKFKDSSELRHIAIDQPQKDIFELMIQNMEEIRGYFEISKSQARKAFLFSVISLLIGLTFFSVSVLIVIQNEKTDAAIIGAIAGGITELVSMFALHIFKKTSEQLNHYHAALHKNEKYLSTVHLVSKLSSEKQDEMYIEIIRSSLNTKERPKSLVNTHAH